jgi:hypothetical protein
MDPKVRAKRMLEKSMRMPVNDVVLEVQKGTIDINDLFKHIEMRLKEKKKEKANG